MQPFKRIKEAQEWVNQHAVGRVGILQANSRLEMVPSRCGGLPGDMRLIDTKPFSN